VKPLEVDAAYAAGCGIDAVAPASVVAQPADWHQCWQRWLVVLVTMVMMMSRVKRSTHAQ